MFSFDKVTPVEIVPPLIVRRHHQLTCDKKITTSWSPGVTIAPNGLTEDTLFGKDWLSAKHQYIVWWDRTQHTTYMTYPVNAAVLNPVSQAARYLLETLCDPLSVRLSTRPTFDLNISNTSWKHFSILLSNLYATVCIFLWIARMTGTSHPLGDLKFPWNRYTRTPRVSAWCRVNPSAQQ